MKLLRIPDSECRELQPYFHLDCHSFTRVPTHPRIRAHQNPLLQQLTFRYQTATECSLLRRL
jgi:hypothetical protein